MRALCNRCDKTPIRVCFLGEARSNAEFLGMCEPCYAGWLSQFPSAR